MCIALSPQAQATLHHHQSVSSRIIVSDSSWDTNDYCSVRPYKPGQSRGEGPIL